MAHSIKSTSRGAKLFLASLSLAASMSGWAWLTLTQAAQGDATKEISEFTPAVTISAVAQTPRQKSLHLASLPVRGLRVVGSAASQQVTFNPAPQSSRPRAIRQAKGSH